MVRALSAQVPAVRQHLHNAVDMGRNLAILERAQTTLAPRAAHTVALGFS
jgi:hypothetical protein